VPAEEPVQPLQPVRQPREQEQVLAQPRRTLQVPLNWPLVALPERRWPEEAQPAPVVRQNHWREPLVSSSCIRP